MSTVTSPSTEVNPHPRFPVCRKAIIERELKPRINEDLDAPGPVWDGHWAVHKDGSSTKLSDGMVRAMRDLISEGHFGSIELPSKKWKRKPSGLTLEEFDKQADQLIAAASLPALVPALPPFEELKPAIYEHLRKSGFAPSFVHEVIEGFDALGDPGAKERYWQYVFEFDGQMRRHNSGDDDGKVDVLPIRRRSLMDHRRANEDSIAGFYSLDVGRLAFHAQIANDPADPDMASSFRFRRWLDECPS